MSKRELKKYLHSLKKAQLEEQIEDLYARFKEVKTYYDFAFNPKEDKLLEEAKVKISREYFPINTRKPKARRSVAQKYIKHFMTLGVDVPVIVDLMLYNIEVAQTYSSQRYVKQEAFYKSMLTSFIQTLDFVHKNGLLPEFELRIEGIIEQAENQRWVNRFAFNQTLKNIHKS